MAEYRYESEHDDDAGAYDRLLLAAEYEAWATGELSEISDAAMCYGSPKYRQEHPKRCERNRDG